MRAGRICVVWPRRTHTPCLPLVLSGSVQDVWPGGQYSPRTAITHVHLPGLQLHNHDLPPLEGFHCLRVLNLAHNGLASAIALMTLGSLEELDIHGNCITYGRRRPPSPFPSPPLLPLTIPYHTIPP